MSYGISVFDSDGTLKYGSELPTIRAVFSLFIAEGSSGSVAIPGFDSNKGFICIDVGGQFPEGLDYNFNNSTKLFSWSNVTGDTIASFFNVS